MKKLFAFMSAVVLLALTALPAGAVVEIKKADAPYNVVYSVYDDTYAERINVCCLLTDNLAAMTDMTEKESMAKYGAKNFYAYVQADYRIDGGKWHVEESWEATPDAAPYGCQIMPGETVRSFDLLYLANDSAVKDAGVLANVDPNPDKNGNHRRTFNLDEHTLEFRLRVSLAFTKEIGTVVTSDWTEPILVKRGKNFGEAPKTLEAPQLSNPRVELTPSNDCPYLTFFQKTPEELKKAEAWFSTQMPTYISTVYYIETGDNSWSEVQAVSPSTSSYSNEDKIIYLSGADVDDEKTMHVKAKYLVYLNDNTLLSEESETLTFNTPRWVEGKGILHARCKVCGICRPIFGICMFVWLGILIVAAIVAIVPLKMHRDKLRTQKALEEEEQRRKEEEERAAKKAAKKRH